MQVKDITNIIEERYPKEAALDFDNVGLLVGSEDKEVHKIYLALDATEEVIANAITFGADMLITHHPMIFHPLKNITTENFVGRRVISLIQNDISYYAMHTNYDVLGMAELSGNLFELSEQEVLDVTYVSDDKEEGIGRVGTLSEKMDLRECCEYVKEKLHLDCVKVFADFTDDKKVYQRMAISPGAGKSMVDAAIKKDAQILVTGDIDHHSGIDAVAQHLTIIDAGHYGTEYIFMDDMHSFLAQKLENVEIKQEMISEPFHMI